MVNAMIKKILILWVMLQGAAYAEVVTTALREVAAHLPLSGLASVAVTAAGAIPWKETVSLASRMAMEVATKSAQAAAIHAQTLHETLEAQRQKQAQARADGKEAEAATAPAEETSASEANTPSAEANSAVAPTEPAGTTAPSAADAAGSGAFADAEAEVPAAAKEEA